MTSPETRNPAVGSGGAWGDDRIEKAIDFDISPPTDVVNPTILKFPTGDGHGSLIWRTRDELIACADGGWISRRVRPPGERWQIDHDAERFTVWKRKGRT